MDELALRTLLNNLEASRSSLHVLLHGFIWAVVVGLGLDLIVIIKEFWNDWREFRYGQIHPDEIHLPTRPSVWLLVLGLLGTALIVIGVAGELYVDVQAGKIETQIREANDNLLGLIIQEAGDAKTSAKTAHAEADTVKQEADAIEKQLQAASKQIIVQGPRWVPLEANEEKFIKALKPFAGQRLVWVRCTANILQPEPYRVEQDLLRFLLGSPGAPGAGWSVEAPVSATWQSCTSGATTEGGNLVIVNSEADATVKAAAKALADTLNGNQVYTVYQQASNDPKAKQFFLSVLGDGNPWTLAAEDPKAVFFLLGSNPTVDLQTLQKEVKTPKP